jgi:hypothetical protein
MDLMEFFQAVLPSSGRYALFSVDHKRHWWAPDIAKLAAISQRANREPNCYYATASFDADSRSQAHVLAKKCFYFDIDAGADKFARDPNGSYETNADAQRALVAFSQAAKLPPSIVVHSGAGLHVYYVLDQEIDADEWKPLAKALGALAKAKGLKVDPSCTADSARVLRAPGALHKNGQRARILKVTGRTYSVDALRSMLDVEEDQFSSMRPVQRESRKDVNATLPAFENTPSSALKVAENCAAVRYVADLKGDVPEPLWRSMIGLVKHCVEGLDQAHEWSRGYEGYDPDETEKKYNQYAAGPPLCTTFERDARKCDGCPSRGKINSPITLGKLSLEQVKQLPEEVQEELKPQTYTFDGVDFGEDFRAEAVDGYWCLMGRKAIDKKTDDGIERSYLWVKVSNEVIWAQGWTESGAADADSAMIDIHVAAKVDAPKRTHTLPATAVATAADLFKWMYGRGMSRANIDNSTSALMHNHLNYQYNAARRFVPRMAVRGRFGLQFEHDGTDAKLVCAHGRYIIRPDGRIDEAVLGKSIAQFRNFFQIKALPPSTTGQWKPGVWQAHILPSARIQAEFFRKYYLREEYTVAQLGIMLSLASPMMVFAADTHLTPGADLPQIGLTVSLYSSSSGQGKTSMQRAVASCYGDPSALVQSGATFDSTLAHQSAKAAVFGTMPLFLDEVTQNTAADVATLINRMAQGADRGRADRSGQARETKTWALVSSLSTNVPQREMLTGAQESSDALQMRLVELTCEFPRIEGAAHVDYEEDRDKMLMPNYGALGAVLHLMIVRSGADASRKYVQQRMREAALLIPGSTQRERFMQRGMACVLACHDALAQMKVTMFDRQVLIDEYVKITRDAVDYSTTVVRTPKQNLQRMISDLAPHIIVTEDDQASTQISRVEPVSNAAQLRAPYAGRRIRQYGTLYLMVDSMKDWCRLHQVSYTDLRSFMSQHNYLRVFGSDDRPTAKTIRITRGTDLSLVSGPCYAIDEGKIFTDVGEGVSNVVPMRRAQ